MHSTRGALAENPWSEFCCHRDTRDSGRDSGREASEGTSTGGPQDFERFLSNRLPVSFSGAQHVIRCGICGVLVVRGRYKEHHDNRHNLCNSKKNMIPFEADFLHNDKIYKGKKIKRSKKKRSNVKEKSECSNEIINKKKSKKMKVKSTNKRLHSKSLFDELDYINKKKKLKCDFIDDSEDIKQFEERNEEDFLSSPKQIEDNFYQDKINITKTYNPLSINDGLCYSNDSVHRTSSDSSTPPSLSLGTLQTLSSPSSLNILNDLSSVITEHYLLPSNDLSTERLGVSCKYQIDSLPWENLPPISNKMYNNGSFYSLKDKELCSNIPIAEEDGEIERAVQSITGFYECLADEFEITNQMSLDEMTSCDGSKSAISKLENISNEENNSDIKCSDMLTGDDGAVLDCFLDEMDNHSNNDKDPLSESCNDANNNSEQNNNEINRNVVDIFMDDCNNMSEYQIDSNLLNIFNSDYEEKFETLINNAMNEFVTQSPQNVSLEHSKCDRKKHSSKVIQARNFDPLKHCGVVGANGQFCYRSLLCKLHTMPQKRQVERSENITSLIKGIRDCNKIKKMNKKSSQQPADSRSSCSKISCDSFIYNCSSSKGSEEISSLLENNLSFTDTEENIFNSSDTCFVNNPVIISGQEPQPLAVPRFDREVIVNCNRPFLAMKSLVWKNRPRSHCDPELLGRFLSNQTEYQSKFTPDKHTDSCFSDSIIDPEDVFNQQSLSAGAVGKSVLTVGTNVSHLPSPRNLAVCSSQMVNINSQHSTPVDRIVTDSIINNVVSLSDPGSCSTMINPSPQTTSLWNPVLATEPVFSNNKFISITDDRTSGAQMLYPVRNNGQIMMVMNKGHKLLNDQVDLTNENFSFSVNQSIPINSLLTLKQQNSNSISSQSRNVHIQQQQPPQQQQHQSTAVPTQQIVSISPLELQKLTDGLCSSNGQIISTECVNKSNEIFINPSKTNEKKNQILYQLNQSQSSNQFLSSTISSKLDSNNLPKPLTVQSSTPNGITHRFVILPDGTISAFTQQSNNLKTNLNQSQAQQQQSSQQQSQHQSQQPQIINRTTLQHPLFGQLSNCGQNQSCFLNGDKLIITPNQVATNTLSQQIIMPQIINQTDLNNQPASRFTLVHQQQKHGANTKTNYNRLQSQHSVSTQLPIESPHQKLSFHIQTPNQYQNHTPNTFFLATTPSGNSSVPLKQQIFLQSNDQMTSDFSLIDSNKFIDGQQYNAQGKLVHHFDNLQCNSDVHTITPSSQDFDFLNHVMNPQPIIIQQPPVNRTSLNQSLSHLSNPNVVQNNFITQTSQDINIGIDGAHSNMSTNGGSNTSNTNSNHNNTTNSSCNNANNNSNNNSNNNNNCNSNNSNSSISSSNSNNNNQHIVINNNSNEKFAQSSQLTLSQRQLSATFSNTSNCSSVVVNQNQQNFKSVPPPLVISQQLLGQSVSNHFGNKPFLDISYQQQSQQKNSHLNQITLDENQFSNEFVIMQSMIA